jgi:peroxiredoxin
LRIHVTKPKPGHNRSWSLFPNPDDDLGLLEREIVVPPGDGPLDLGKLTVKIKDSGAPEKPPVADFGGQTLDGHAVSLSQYRGKYLLLTFWAAWSDRCAEQLEAVRKLEEQLNRDDRIAFLGVSLDEDLNTVRQAVESRGYKWTQAQLDSASVAKATGNFDVSSLPAIYLIDPKGRVAASNLEGDRLRATVQRELKN